MSTFFTADLHLFDEDISKYRGFRSPGEVVKLIANNWNSMVGAQDTVYILGDISKDDTGKATQFILNHLKGKKILIPGNHDTMDTIRAFTACDGCSVLFLPIVTIGGGNFICSHIPVHENEMTWFDGNIHGHIHAPYPELGYFPKEYPSPKSSVIPPNYLNVNVEFHNYFPVTEEAVLKYFTTI